MFEDIAKQNTLPTPVIKDKRPTFKEMRERYGLSQHDIATQAGVHVLFVYCLEKVTGSRIEFSYALSLLYVLSKYAGRPVRFEEMRGIHLKNTTLEQLMFMKCM